MGSDAKADPGCSPARFSGAVPAGNVYRRANATGALIGFIGSAFVSLLVLSSANTKIHFMTIVSQGIASCFILGFIASILVPGKPRPSPEPPS